METRDSNLDATFASLIAAADKGDRAAADALFSALYAELHRLARHELARQGAPPSLSVTTLLHEAYLQMAGRDGVSFPDRPRFMGYAARVMRGLIIDRARNRQAVKRGGQFEITSLGTEAGEDSPDVRELTSVSEALDELERSLQRRLFPFRGLAMPGDLVLRTRDGTPIPHRPADGYIDAYALCRAAGK